MISVEDRKAIVDVLQGAAIMTLCLWAMPKDLTWVTLIWFFVGGWGAHRFDRGCKQLKKEPTP